jgi:hypothetical protein
MKDGLPRDVWQVSVCPAGLVCKAVDHGSVRTITANNSNFSSSLEVAGRGELSSGRCVLDL